MLVFASERTVMVANDLLYRKRRTRYPLKVLEES